MILVVGATGMLGSEICRQLAARGERVRALVRASSNTDKVGALEALGIEIVTGDLRERASLERACSGVEAVVTTASAMPFSYVAGENDITAVDLDGTTRLIDVARVAGVGHFIYTSFSGNLELDCPLLTAKRTVERTLRTSGLRYTILRPSAIMEAWLSPVVGFDYPNAKATIYGTGDRPVSYIALADLAEFAVRSLAVPAAWSATLELGGPDSVAPLDAVRIFERISGRKFELSFVPEGVLLSQQAAATDEMAQTFPVLMRSLAQGDLIPMAGLLSWIPVELTPVTAYAERVLGKVPAHT